MNSDDIAQGERGCVYPTAGCEINFANLPANFGVRSLARFDPRPAAAVSAGATTSASRTKSAHGDRGDGGVVPQHLQGPDRAQQRRAVGAATTRRCTVYNPIRRHRSPAYNLARVEGAALVDYVDSNDPDLKRAYNGIEINFNARLPRGARLFGGTSTERTLANSCSAAGHNPNLLALLRQSQSGIPFTTSFKLAGTYPLPWYGITVSGSLQALAGSLLGIDALPYGVFTAGTGFDMQPNGRETYLLVTPTTNWTPATCKDTCEVHDRPAHHPGADADVAQRAADAGTARSTHRASIRSTSRWKNFNLGHIRVNPKLDIFNAFNSDDYTGVSTMQFGAATYERPSTILQGRIIRIGVDVKW